MFFKNLEKFKYREALITEKKKIYYEDILKALYQLKNVIKQKRHVCFDGIMYSFIGSR